MSDQNKIASDNLTDGKNMFTLRPVSSQIFIFYFSVKNCALAVTFKMFMRYYSE